MQEIVDIVNKKDKVIGKATRQEVKEKKLIYRCIGIYVEKNGKIIIQKRSKNKNIRPDNWSIIEETVKSEETYEKAAIRGLKEELGLKTKKLVYLGKKLIKDKKYSDYFFISIYKCKAIGKPRLQKEEVEKIKEFTKKQLEILIKTRKKISPSLKETFHTYLKSGE
ncbi:MAG: NUDIX domain-containing protein [Candidatus Diapherotrites archaeon]